MNIDERCYGYEPAASQLREIRALLRRAENFIKNVPTDAQLDAVMSNGDTGRAVWAALNAHLR